jgi:hypothetical protein
MRRKAGISASLVGFTFAWLVKTRIYCTSFLSKYKQTKRKGSERSTWVYILSIEERVKRIAKRR